MAKLLFFVTEDWYFCSHRLPVARAAQAAGHEVVVACRVHRHAEVIETAGFRLIPLDLRRGGQNPLQELVSLRAIWRIYRRERPDIVHHVALKPVLYGALAAYLARVPAVVNALTGLGYVFSSPTLKARLLRPFVTLALRGLLNAGRSVLILQNPDDGRMLVQEGMVEANRIRLIRGSGVDIRRFALCPPAQELLPLVVLPARLLRDKGVVEFVAAARLLKAQGVVARFALVGERDPENAAAIDDQTLADWMQEGCVECWGRHEDMPAVFAQASIVCLPSYREGLPKALLEAAACGRALVATDVPGCREIVIDGHNGLLVPVQDVVALAAALRRLLENAAWRDTLGRNGRALVEAEFSEERVMQQTLAVYRALLGR
ncbi:MAG: glycosyltransferase family 4 protein [Sterolibacterium sp.]|nr:glycosyltransferase family 4 protein [Sterolibacterium sp.]MBP9799986.1 glycosyltransferase family 4 protein [Sterolibacterium sp.]